MRTPVTATFTTAIAVTTLAVGFSVPAEARSCSELRALCWTMRAAKSDCTEPFRRCQRTGVFVTPLGRRFPANSRD